MHRDHLLPGPSQIKNIASFLARGLILVRDLFVIMYTLPRGILVRFRVK